MTYKEQANAKRKELILEVQAIADGWGELAAETGRKLDAWKRYSKEHGLTRPESRGYEV